MREQSDRSGRRLADAGFGKWNLGAASATADALQVGSCSLTAARFVALSGATNTSARRKTSVTLGRFDQSGRARTCVRAHVPTDPNKSGLLVLPALSRHRFRPWTRTPYRVRVTLAARLLANLARPLAETSLRPAIRWGPSAGWAAGNEFRGTRRLRAAVIADGVATVPSPPSGELNGES